MSSRHRARERSLQILFQWDARKGPIEDAISSFYETLYSEQSESKPARDEFVDRLVKGVAENIDEIDRRLAQHAEHWRIERMPAVDRNVLRLAIYELMATDTPPPVAIDEALELARRFSGEESVHFINGVLDAAKREIKGAAGRS
ncbi:MAG TPA: transcription antitermination factor NusB [Bryobacteraceae bacterium]|jgi:transcription antitermination protein NusB|nr:transcription antitermination factor NusB [Bryobacteraceae bacterium]